MNTSIKEELYNSLYYNPIERKEILCSSMVMEQLFAEDAIDRGPDKEYLKAELHSDKRDKINQIKDIVDHNLPFLEREIIKRIYFDNMKQDGIGALYNIKQEMVCYYKKRAIQRIRYYLRAREIDINEMEQNLTDILTAKQLQAMMYYFKKHNQQSIAKEFNITQSAISSRLKLGIKQIRQAYIDTYSSKYRLYYKIFKYLFDFNSLQSTQMRRRNNEPREIIFSYTII